ncbi:MAG: agmatinase [Desulfobacterales bacterium]|jgi:agmatinase
MPEAPDNVCESSKSHAPTFMGCKMARGPVGDDIDVVISGIPFDQTSTGRPGARLGPASIRQASDNLAWELRRWPWDFSVFDILGIVDCGDLCIDTADKNQILSQIQQHAFQILQAEKTMLTFGGDHYISLPLLREHAKKYGPLALIHFDAHADAEREPDLSHHGTMFFQAQNESLINARNSVQIGIRTEYIRDDHHFTVLDAEWVMDHGLGDILKTINSVVSNHPAYVTFDIDCLDPAFAPGTGTPVVGGLSTARALQIMRGLAGLNLVGMDLVEVSPPHDHADITSLAAATLGLEFLYVLAADRNKI